MADEHIMTDEELNALFAGPSPEELAELAQAQAVTGAESAVAPELVAEEGINAALQTDPAAAGMEAMQPGDTAMTGQMPSPVPAEAQTPAGSQVDPNVMAMLQAQTDQNNRMYELMQQMAQPQPQEQMQADPYADMTEEQIAFEEYINSKLSPLTQKLQAVEQENAQLKQYQSQVAQQDEMRRQEATIADMTRKYPNFDPKIIGAEMDRYAEQLTQMGAPAEQASEIAYKLLSTPQQIELIWRGHQALQAQAAAVNTPPEEKRKPDPHVAPSAQAGPTESWAERMRRGDDATVLNLFRS